MRVNGWLLSNIRKSAEIPIATSNMTMIKTIPPVIQPQMDKWLADAKKNKRILHLFEKLEQNGCAINWDSISVQDCDKHVFGGFNSDKLIVLCRSNLISSRQVATTIQHELIHAFDDCKDKLDTTSCESVACSEVRAAALSGDCDVSEELMRGNFPLLKRCVRRRALVHVGLI